MRINVNDPKAAEVEAVYLNGKRLAMCVEADDQEGWAVVVLPPVDPAAAALKDKGVLATGDPIAADEWQTKRLEGEVEIVLREREGLDDSGLDN